MAAFRTHTLTGTVADLLGVDYDPKAVTLTLVAVNSTGMVNDPEAGTRLGVAKDVSVAADGSFSIPGIWNSTDSGLAYQIQVKAKSRARTPSRLFDEAASQPFLVNADSVFHAVAASSPIEFVPAGQVASFAVMVTEVQAAVGQAQAAKTAAEAARDQASLISGLTGEDAAVAALLSNPASQTGAAFGETVSAVVADKGARGGYVLDNATETTVGTAIVVPVASVGSLIFGSKLGGSGGLWVSADSGQTWTLASNAVTPYNGVHALGDGEILVNGNGELWRSTGWNPAAPTAATWASVLTANGTSYFVASDVDTWGQYVIAAEYASPRTDARFVYLSTDHGQTFTPVRDLDAMHPTMKTETHWHAVALDPWAGLAHPRLWASHGDGPRGVYYSDDLGATWTLYDDTWQPMPMLAAPNGIVTSTDQPNPDGVWLIPRDLTARRCLVKINAPVWNGALLGFGHGATRGPDGTVYITFRGDQQTYFTKPNPARIFATDGNSASLIYETATAGTVGVTGSTNFEGLPAITPDGHLLATYIPMTGGRRIIRGEARRGSASGALLDGGNVLTGQAADRNSIAIGVGVYKARNQSVLIGTGAGASLVATDESVVLIGEESDGGNRATGLGMSASVGALGVGVGYDVTAGSESVVIGSQANGGTSSQAVVVGRNASTTKALTTTLGYGASTTGSGATAVGSESVASGQDSVALGRYATASAYGAVAIGNYDTKAIAASALALGASANANHAYSVALPNTTTLYENQLMVGARDVWLTDSGRGVVLKAPNGTHYRISVGNTGTLSTAAA